jgi:hypothetical protein
MGIAQLIEMLERRIVFLQMLRTSAANLGDISRVTLLDVDTAEAELTLNKLRAIPE